MAYRLVGHVSGVEINLNIEGESSILGSSSNCDLCVDHPTVSRRHLQLTPTAKGLHVLDLGSTNGTWIDNVRVAEGIVADGGSIKLGQVELRVDLLDVEAPTDAVHSDALNETDVARPSIVDLDEAPVVEHSSGKDPFECFVTGAMRDALDELEGGHDLEKLAAIVCRGLCACLPLSTVEIGRKTPGTGATLFCLREDGLEFSSQQMTRTRGDLYLYCAFKHLPNVADLEALLDAALRLVLLGDMARSPDGAE